MSSRILVSHHYLDAFSLHTAYCKLLTLTLLKVQEGARPQKYLKKLSKKYRIFSDPPLINSLTIFSSAVY
jgi:hypothetical protein